MNLVILKFVQLGDNVVFVPVVQALRERFPGWRLTLLTTPREAPLYAPWIAPGELLTAPQLRFNSSWRRPWEFARWWARVRSRRPDACLVSFDQGNVAHLLARHSGAPVRVGAALPHVRIRHSLTHDVRLPADATVAGWHWAMARTLVDAAGGDTSGWPATPPRPDLRHLTGGAGRRNPRRVVIHAGSNQEVTRWPLGRFAQVAGRLARDHDVVWIDRPETAAAALPAGVRRVAPASLADLATLLAGAGLFLGNNSGPMHLANALGGAGVVVTGPSAAAWNPYWHPERWRVLRHPTLPCAPCEWADRFTHECSLAGDPLACLRFWTPEVVEQHCREMLARPAAG